MVFEVFSVEVGMNLHECSTVEYWFILQFCSYVCSIKNSATLHL